MKKEIPETTIKTLIIRAKAMLLRSYIPYSNFAVGASLLSSSGNIYDGCNVENAAYGPSNCAERTAFFKAVSEGDTKFDAIAIVGGPGRHVADFCPPCGVCRQVMAEFCRPDEFQIIVAKSEEDYKIYTLEELLPLGFGASDLEK